MKKKSIEGSRRQEKSGEVVASDGGVSVIMSKWMVVE